MKDRQQYQKVWKKDGEKYINKKFRRKPMEDNLGNVIEDMVEDMYWRNRFDKNSR